MRSAWSELTDLLDLYERLLVPAVNMIDTDVPDFYDDECLLQFLERWDKDE